MTTPRCCAAGKERTISPLRHRGVDAGGGSSLSVTRGTTRHIPCIGTVHPLLSPTPTAVPMEPASLPFRDTPGGPHPFRRAHAVRRPPISDLATVGRPGVPSAGPEPPEQGVP